MDKAVQHLQVQPITTFDARGNPVRTVRYSYFLGANGPFDVTFPEGQDTTANVQAAIDAQCQKLRELGAIPY